MPQRSRKPIQQKSKAPLKRRKQRKPSAVCCGCERRLQLDAFTHEQWEQARVNMPALCAACKSGQKNKGKRKLDAESLQTCLCVGCHQPKIADAFPRAQLMQAEADANRQCLECLETQRAEMQCCMCSRSKSLHGFSPRMVTMPASGILCLQCQDEVRRQTRTCTRHGYFTCRKCAQIFPLAVCKLQSGRCINCAMRGQRKVGEQTCRNKACKKRWVEQAMPEDGKRPPRYCPDCRQ